MRSVEGEGGSIDEAITRALAALGVTRDQVEIDILENATPGVLGFGRKRARVRATIRQPLAAWSATEEAPAAVPRSEGASGPRPSADAFDGAGLVTELLRRMGWRAEVRASTQGDTRTLEITSADPAVIGACDEEVLLAFAFLVNRIAERQVRDGTRFIVTLARPGAGGDHPATARRSTERARSRPGERRGGGKPRR